LLSGELLHYSISSVEEYIKKLSFYTNLEVEWMAEKGIKPIGIYGCAGSFFRFFYYYLSKLGFLDGYEGFLYHSLSAFYYFFKYVRLRESLGAL